MRVMDPLAESGTESVARVRFHAAGLETEQQRRLPPYRADFTIAERLIVEVDGREFHDGAGAFEADRRRWGAGGNGGAGARAGWGAP